MLPLKVELISTVLIGYTENVVGDGLKICVYENVCIQERECVSCLCACWEVVKMLSETTVYCLTAVYVSRIFIFH